MIDAPDKTAVDVKRIRADALEEAAQRVLRVRMPQGDGPILLMEVLEAAARAVRRGA